MVRSLRDGEVATGALFGSLHGSSVKPSCSLLDSTMTLTIMNYIR